ncbi:MAG TPA: P-loop NTPase [Candidatus Bathyarchaeia archaeon]|nr:P-loop NTPase [Candidatus Bathyarchaeia archaeon]
MVDKNLIMGRLETVLDPEIGRSIVDLNMVRDVTIDNGNVSVRIALTVAHCPLAKTLQTDVENAIRKLDDVKSVKVDTTTMTRKELEELRVRLQASAAQSPPPRAGSMVGPGIERLGRRGIRSIIAIVSGKGGVGKSFVTSILASELRKRGYEVGVLDADLTGPSIAKILGVAGKPFKGPNGGIVPLKTQSGIKVMSINLVLEDPNMPVIWRGPIVNSVIRQLYWDVDWGDLHYLLVDLPPGCVASDTMVYANPHPVPISQLNPGDHVYSVDASISESGRSPNALSATLVAKRVLEVLPQGEAEVFEIRTRTRKIAATLNHPFLAVAKSRSSGGRNYRYSLYWKQLGQLRPGDIIAVVKRLPQNKAVPLELSPITDTSSTGPILPSHTTDDFCRIIGYFMGDGFVRLNPKTRTYQVMFAEPINGRYRAKYIELIKRIVRGARISKNALQFGVSSKTLALLFDKLDLHRSALQKRVPKWVFELPESQKLAFIEGYCDADGFRRLRKSRFRRPGWMVFETPNRGLLEGIRALAISVGLKVTNLNSRIRSLETPSGHSYATTFWSFECNASARTSRYGAGLIRGNGRQAVGRALVNQYVGFERVSKLTPVGRREVYDIRVEGNENFIADGLVVHNTSDAPLTVFQSLPLDGVIVISSPQDLASMIVSKAVNMAKKMNAPVLGLIENMSYLTCPDCGGTMYVFGEPQGQKLALSLDLPFLGAIPLDPAIAKLSDEGRIEEYSNPIITGIVDELRTRAVRQAEQLTQALPLAWSIEPAR